MAKKKKLPPVHAGEVLHEEYLIPAEVTVNALALALRVPVSRVLNSGPDRSRLGVDEHRKSGTSTAHRDQQKVNRSR